MTSNAVTTHMTRALTARREGRLEDARRDLAEAVALCRRADVPNKDLVRALKALGQIERDRGSQAAALRCYEEAVDVSRNVDDGLLLAHSMRHLGDVYQDAGRSDEAHTCFVEALAIYRSREDVPWLDLANAIRPMAILQASRGATDEACRLFEEARDLYTACKVSEGVDECEEALDKLTGSN